MSLTSALQIGRTGLAASQAAIEVTGNNLANMATKGYHRQRVELIPAGDQRISQQAFIGRGVQISQIVRQVNESLENRLRLGIADQSGAQITQDILTQVEMIHNELGEGDLSSRLGQFFAAWSELANAPDSVAQRSLVAQQGQSMALFIGDLRSRLVEYSQNVDEQIGAAVNAVSDVLARIEHLNDQIARIERGSGTAHSLRDQRDMLLSDLSQFIDVSVVEQRSGKIDVFIGSMPIVLNGKAQAITTSSTAPDENGQTEVRFILAADQAPLLPTSGSLGALLEGRGVFVANAISQLDAFANDLMYQVNRVHSQGQSMRTVEQVVGSATVGDVNAQLNSSAAALGFAVMHGSFQIHTTQQSTGQRDTSLINIDLDGIDASNDTTLTSLVAALNAVAGITASATVDGRLRIQSNSPDITISFSDDNSGVLASLGINTFFAGRDARDMSVNSIIQSDPGAIAAAQGHVVGDNRNALAIAALADQSLDALGGVSLTQLWNRNIKDQAVQLGQAQLAVETRTAVVESLSTQQQSISGVNTDEEAINLLAFQRAYQGSARFLTVVNEMMATLMAAL